MANRALPLIYSVHMKMVAGGQEFYRSVGMERNFRDVQAARYHPLQKLPQTRLSGRLALGLSIDE